MISVLENSQKRHTSSQVSLQQDLIGGVFSTSIHECTPFITLNLGSIGVDRVISEPCYKGTILQGNYRKMTIPLQNFMVKTNWEPQHDRVISKSVL